MQKVFVGLERRRAAVDGQQVADVAVEVLQLAQVDLVLTDVVRQGLVERDQILEVDAQDGHLEAAAFVVNPSVVDVVAAWRQQLRQLTQGLKNQANRKKNWVKIWWWFKGIYTMWVIRVWATLVMSGGRRLEVSLRREIELWQRPPVTAMRVLKFCRALSFCEGEQQMESRAKKKLASQRPDWW